METKEHPGFKDIIINDELENIGLEELKKYKMMTIKEAISMKTGIYQKEIEKTSGDL